MSNTLLLTKPEEYAKTALACLEYQLLTAKSKHRKLRLASKIDQWKKTIELLSEPDGNEEESVKADTK